MQCESRSAAGQQAVMHCVREYLSRLSCLLSGLQQIVTNFEKSKESLSGPVAIVAVGAEAARSDIANLYQFAAILNINLAVINILPLPVRHISLVLLNMDQKWASQNC